MYTRVLLTFIFLIRSNSGRSCSCGNEIYAENIIESAISSSNYPQEYCPLMTCVYKILPMDGMGIELRVNEKDMEESDSLELYQYDVKNETDIYIFQKRIPNFNERYGSDRSYASPTGFELRFTSDHNKQGKGFYVQFWRRSQVTCPMPYLMARPQEQKVDISSIQFSKTQGCVFRLETMPGKRIALQVTMNTEYYSLEGRENGSSVLLWRDSGNSKKRHFSQSNSIDIWITMRTDRYWNYVNNIPELIFKEIDYEPCACSDPQIMLNGSDTIVSKSPGYPELLCSYFACTHTVTAAEPEKENVTTMFLVNVDYLGLNKEDSLVLSTDFGEERTLSAQKYLDAIYILPGSKLGLTFESSNDMSNHGYNATVQRIEVPTECLCPKMPNSTLSHKGSFSMTIPSYCQFLHCEFSMKNSNETSAKFRMQISHELNNPFEAIYLWDGKNRTMLTRSDEHHAINYLTETASVHLTYKRESWLTDNTGPSSSFQISWDYDGFCRCGPTEFVAQNWWQLILSPDFPNNYCTEMHCVYRIRAGEGQKINIYFPFFETELFGDKLYIYSGEEKRENLIQPVYHGNQTRTNPDHITSSKNLMTIVFVSDAQTVDRGFKINYIAGTVFKVSDPWSDSTLLHRADWPALSKVQTTTTTMPSIPDTAELTTTPPTTSPSTETTISTTTQIPTSASTEALLTEEETSSSFPVSRILISTFILLLIAVSVAGALLYVKRKNRPEIPTVFFAEDRVRTASTADSSAPLCDG